MSDDTAEIPQWARDGFERLRRGDKAGGLAAFLSRATSGDPAAMHGLYQIYDKGVFVERSGKTAREWLNKAVDLNHGPALYSMSQMYAGGNGVESSVPRALELLEQAGASGYAPAYESLGLCFEYGELGLAAEPARAAVYYVKAIDIGSARGQFYLGRLYIAGRGVTKDTKRGFALFEGAAQASDVEGLSGLAELFETGHEGHDEDRKKALELYRRAARLGHEQSREAIRRFPRVVPLGQIVCSPSAARLLDSDRGAFIQRHATADWGDVSPDDWDRNDQALAKGGPVYSIHRFPSITVLVQTDGDRSSSYMEIEGESSETSHGGVFGTVRHAKELYEWWHFFKDVKELLSGR